MQEKVKYLEDKIHKIKISDSSSEQNFRSSEEYKSIMEDMKLLLRHREELSEIKDIIRKRQEQAD